MQLALLGPLRITAAGQEVAGGMRKARELLAFLAVQQPDGATGETISEALWPEADPGRAAGQRNLALRKAREMLRTAAGLPEPRWILNASGRYRLDPALIGTDLEAFGAALEEARNASGDARLAACRRAVALYRGELAEGTGYEWAEPYAETARRRALDAWTTIAEILQPSDPGRGAVRPGDGPFPRPLQRVPVRADHAAAGRSGPPRGRPPHPGPAGIETHRPRPGAQLPDQAGRRRPARRRTGPAARRIDLRCRSRAVELRSYRKEGVRRGPPGGGPGLR